MGLRRVFFHGAFAAVVAATLSVASGAASAQPYPWSYRHGWGPVMYDEGFFVGAVPQYPAAGYGHEIVYGATGVYVDADVSYEPIIRRDFIPVTAYQPVDTVVGFQPVVRRRPVRHVRRPCQCNGFY